MRAGGASAVEMEAGGVAERARARGVPFYCVRVVTDLADEDMANNFNQALRPDGHFATMSILRGALRNPLVRLPELLRLRNRCVRAAGSTGRFYCRLPILTDSPYPKPCTPRSIAAAASSASRRFPRPSIGSGEILIRVEACGICHTDLKKIEYNLLTPPRVYGHETAGVVAAVGSGVTKFKPGDRVVAFHHIPCRQCFYCQRKIYAQCPVYKKVGITAGFEPAGGGFAQYVRVMDWIVEAGVERIPDGISFERATLVEPLNTCLKAVVQCDPQPEDLVVILGQGPIGLMFTMLTQRTGARVAATRHDRRPAGTGGAMRRRVRVGSPQGGCRGGSTATDRRPRRGPGDCGCIGSGHRGTGDGVLAARLADSAFRANFGHGTDRNFRRGPLCR